MLKLIKLLKPYTGTIIFIALLFLTQAMIDLSLPTFMAEIVDHGIVKGDLPYIYKTGFIMISIALFGVLCALTAGFFSSRTSLGFSMKLRDLIFTKTQGFSLNEYDKIGSASLITRATNDVAQVQQALIIMLSMMMRAPLMCVGGLIMAISRDRELSLVFAFAVPALGLIIYFVQKNAIPLFIAMQKKLDRLNLVIREKLTGIREVRAFDMIAHEEKKFDTANADLNSTALSLANLMAFIMPAMMAAMNFTMIAIVWFGGLRLSSGKMHFGDILAFIQYVNLILFALMMVSMLFILIPRAEVSAGRINEILETKPTIEDPVNPVTPSGRKGYIEFKNVSFTYKGARQKALSRISFSAGPGEITAIIGGTGSGKSTLVNLIPRFYDVEEGEILVDSVNVKDYPQSALRPIIGYVAQKAMLFTGTVADNLRFGNENAPMEDIVKAAKTAQAHSFIEAMAEGYNSLLAQAGKNLSGGQKQRLCIARAIVIKPEIYIFDDSFSALDFRTDADLRAELKKELKDSTVIIVAQRVTTIMDADRIIVLDDGKVAGMGTHKELFAACGVYREIVLSQVSPEEVQ